MGGLVNGQAVAVEGGVADGSGHAGAASECAALDRAAWHAEPHRGLVVGLALEVDGDDGGPVLLGQLGDGAEDLAGVGGGDRVVVVTPVREVETLRHGLGLNPARRGAQAGDMGVTQRTNQVGDLVAGQRAGLAEDPLERVLDQIFSTLARAGQPPSSVPCIQLFG